MKDNLENVTKPKKKKMKENPEKRHCYFPTERERREKPVQQFCQRGL